MSIYFLVHDAAVFHDQIQPALAGCWRQRSFAPCRSLAAAFEGAVQAFAQRYHTGAEEPLVTQVDRGLPFDRNIWRLLVGEILLYGAAAIPEIQTAPEALTCLLAPDRYLAGDLTRPRFAPIQQIHFGTQDLIFGGGFYRPEQAGWNDVEDVVRLADYLTALDPRQWTAAALANLQEMSDDEERAEELEFVREWFPDLVNLYQQARQHSQVIVCEIIQSAGAI